MCGSGTAEKCSAATAHGVSSTGIRASRAPPCIGTPGGALTKSKPCSADRCAGRPLWLQHSMGELDGNVMVYRNRRLGCWSVLRRGRVVARVQSIVLEEVAFRVRASGHTRACRLGQRNVHAFACGRPITWQEVPLHAVPVRYSPYGPATFHPGGRNTGGRRSTGLLRLHGRISGGPATASRCEAEEREHSFERRPVRAGASGGRRVGREAGVRQRQVPDQPGKVFLLGEPPQADAKCRVRVFTAEADRRQHVGRFQRAAVAR